MGQIVQAIKDEITRKGLGLSTNSSVPFTAKGKRELLPRGQVFPFILVVCRSLLAQ